MRNVHLVCRCIHAILRVLTILLQKLSLSLLCLMSNKTICRYNKCIDITCAVLMCVNRSYQLFGCTVWLKSYIFYYILRLSFCVLSKNAPVRRSFSRVFAGSRARSPNRMMDSHSRENSSVYCVTESWCTNEYQSQTLIVRGRRQVQKCDRQNTTHKKKGKKERKVLSIFFSRCTTRVLRVVLFLRSSQS